MCCDLARRRDHVAETVPFGRRSRTHLERTDAVAAAGGAARRPGLLDRDADPEGRRDGGVLRRTEHIGNSRKSKWLILVTYCLSFLLENISLGLTGECKICRVTTRLYRSVQAVG